MCLAGGWRDLQGVLSQHPSVPIQRPKFNVSTFNFRFVLSPDARSSVSNSHEYPFQRFSDEISRTQNNLLVYQSSCYLLGAVDKAEFEVLVFQGTRELPSFSLSRALATFHNFNGRKSFSESHLSIILYSWRPLSIPESTLNCLVWAVFVT